MFLLKKESYGKIRPIFEKRLDFEMPVKMTDNKNCNIQVKRSGSSANLK